MSDMSPEHRDNIRKANQRRAKYLCPMCGAFVDVRDGKDVGGVPGIQYRQCNGCGWIQAITHKPRKYKP
jgi:predicted RNA-binding Zn-ribbon protein involved in translation (DUF1610 family)